jgi:demethylmenaquinone methyltransferase / 2-methoxy-6-polyprenyl-1,4-benzoquinol methylase
VKASQSLSATTGAEKPLHGMFSAVPPRYDLINSVITWNMDKHWRRLAAKACLAARPDRFLDLCCGTGDLAIAIARMARYPMDIQALDYSRPMLMKAERKTAQLNSKTTINFVQGEVDKLPFPSSYFDCIGISFGFRNLTYKNPLAGIHLDEIVRVLKPENRFVLVESSQPCSAFVRSCYHFYMRQYVSRMGYCLSGNRGAYHYLSESACRFYEPAELKLLLLEHGFKSVDYKPLFFGAAGIHIATK